MMTIPALTTERLYLIPPGANCASAYLRFYTDASASASYGGPLSREAAWTRLAADLGSWYLQGFGIWALRHRARQEVVGVCGFWERPGWPRELTWWLLPAYRRQGLAKEASLTCIDHAYTEFGWAAVHSYANDDNLAARATLESLGAVVVERRCFPDGRERDLYLFPRP